MRPGDRGVLITGGGRGLGRAFAEAFAGAGWRVAINYRSSEEEAREFAGKYPSTLLLRADVGRPEEVEEMSAGIKNAWGELDAVINNAGIISDSLLLRTTEESWEEVMRVNLGGVFSVIKHMAPLMREGGHILNVSSRTALRGQAGQAAYSTSKAAVLGLTRTAARELGERGIRVNALMPGYLETEMGRSAAGPMERARGESLLGRLSEPSEAVSFALWLFSTQGITGQVFTLDSRI